jgi:hypothetical protein
LEKVTARQSLAPPTLRLIVPYHREGKNLRTYLKNEYKPKGKTVKENLLENFRKKEEGIRGGKHHISSLRNFDREIHEIRESRVCQGAREIAGCLAYSADKKGKRGKKVTRGNRRVTARKAVRG